MRILIFPILLLGVLTPFSYPSVFLNSATIFGKDVIKLLAHTFFIFIPYDIFFHIPNILNHENINLLTENSLRTTAASGWYLVRTTLAFESWSYALYAIRPFLVLIVVCIISLIFKIRKSINIYPLAILASVFLPFFLLSFKLPMMDVWHDYWGIYYVQFLLVAAPIILLI